MALRLNRDVLHSGECIEVLFEIRGEGLEGLRGAVNN
jgi:hypothetical protein